MRHPERAQRVEGSAIGILTENAETTEQCLGGFVVPEVHAEHVVGRPAPRPPREIPCATKADS